MWATNTGLGFRVEGLGFRVQGLGFRVVLVKSVRLRCRAYYVCWDCLRSVRMQASSEMLHASLCGKCAS